MTILDDDGGPILVSISPSYVNVAEGGPDTTFTVSRTGDLSAPLDVNFTTSPWDSATAGVDYQLSPTNVVTIPAGAASASITLSVVDDTVQENTEFATISLVSGVGYELMWPSYAQVSIADNDGPPVVSIAATDPIASEPGLPEGTATFTLTRIGGDLAAPLTVSYSNAWFDSATAGVDYEALPGTVTFEPGQATATITITPIDDLVGENPETVSLQLNNPVDGTYIVDWSNSFATATILDDDGGIPVVTWEATVPTVVEGSGGAATVTLTRTGGNLNTPLTVNYYTGLYTPGTARSGVDYQTLPYIVTFAAGSSTATIDVVPIDDALGEQDETVVLSLGFFDPTGTYAIGASSDTELTILDDDGGQAAVSLAVTDPRAMEASADPATFTITRAGGNLNAPLTVSYFYSSGTAEPGVDFQSLPLQVTFAAGQTSATIDIVPIEDNISEPDETVSLFLPESADGDYRIDYPAGYFGTVIIADGAPPVVDPIGGAASGVRGQTLAFSASFTDPDPGIRTPSRGTSVTAPSSRPIPQPIPVPWLPAMFTRPSGTTP